MARERGNKYMKNYYQKIKDLMNYLINHFQELENA